MKILNNLYQPLILIAIAISILSNFGSVVAIIEPLTFTKISISNQGLWLRDRSNLGEIIINGTFLDTERARIQKPVFFLINSDTQCEIYTLRNPISNVNEHVRGLNASGNSSSGVLGQGVEVGCSDH